MNSRGNLLSIWWIAVLAFTGTGIVIGVSIFSNGEMNLRDMESSILNQRFVNCVYSEGTLDNDIFGDFNVYQDCGLYPGAFSQGDLFLYGVIENASFRKEIKIGNNAFERDCEIVLSKKISFSDDQYPACVLYNARVLDSTGRLYNFRVMSASNHQGGWK